MNKMRNVAQAVCPQRMHGDWKLKCQSMHAHVQFFIDDVLKWSNANTLTHPEKDTQRLSDKCLSAPPHTHRHTPSLLWVDRGFTVNASLLQSQDHKSTCWFFFNSAQRRTGGDDSTKTGQNSKWNNGCCVHIFLQVALINTIGLGRADLNAGIFL